MHDDSAGNALGALAGEPVPMATTSVEEVIRKGKRRLRVQRIATVGGAAAVVAVIAASTLFLRPGGSESNVPVASRPTAPSTTNALTGYTAVVMPGTDTALPTSTTPLPPNASTRQSPPSAPTITTTTKLPVSATSGDCGVFFMAPAHTQLLPRNTVNKQFLQAYLTATEHSPIALRPSGNENVDKPDEFLQRVIAEDRNGELVLDVWVHGGTPAEAANASVSQGADCSSPRRKTLADGTVMQLYARGSKGQVLHVFAPSGRTYVLTLIPDTGWPMSEAQLATVADELAKLG